MQNSDSVSIIPFPAVKVSDADRIQKLLDELFKLRQCIDELVNTVAMQKELIQQLRDENARLKGLKPKPKIDPSQLEGPRRRPNWRTRIGRHKNQEKSIPFFLWVKNSTNLDAPSLRRLWRVRVGSIANERPAEISRLAEPVIKKIRRPGKPGQPKGKKRRKKTALQVHEKPVIQPKEIPGSARFKGYKRFTVQEIIFKPHNVQYYLARWQLPDGTYITGELPKDVHGHYGPKLIAYILHQYHTCRVTEHLLLDQLRALGILMSMGQLNNILIENKEAFIEEAAELLPVAARVEGQIQTDDTGGRHKGQNQYTTIIGNRWFSLFVTTGSKSRINFLKLLQGGKEEYLINEDTLEYLQVRVPGYFPGYVSLFLGKKFTTLAEWKSFLQECCITQETEVRFLTEAALYASVIQNGIPKHLGVHSDDAGQFDVFVHSLCWIHEERHYRKLIMTTDESRADLERIKDQIWSLYGALKQYKKSPNQEFADRIRKEFDDIFQQKTSSPTLNRQLEKTYKKKEELLRVLEREETPLHNNSSETCARAAKIKLKISGGTRSELGQKVRDTFLSLKQTCLKLGINFISFLEDRVRGRYEISRLAIIIRERALAGTTDPPIPLAQSSLPEAALQLDCLQLVG
jgi:hypothetical protein